MGKRQRRVSIGTGLLILDGALQVSGFTNSYVAVTLGVVSAHFLLPACWEYIRDGWKKRKKPPFQLSWEPDDQTCCDDNVPSNARPGALSHHRQFRLKITNLLTTPLSNVNVRLMDQSGINHFGISLPKTLRRKDNATSTIVNPLDHDYYDLVRWEHDRQSRLFFCFSDGEVEIERAQRVEFKVTVRFSAAGADRYVQKIYEFVQPTDRQGLDWMYGRILMRENVS